MRLSPTCAMKPWWPTMTIALSVVPMPRFAVSFVDSSWILEQARCTACSTSATMSFVVTLLPPVAPDS
jgi:hypothetical protein